MEGGVLEVVVVEGYKDCEEDEEEGETEGEEPGARVGECCVAH